MKNQENSSKWKWDVHPDKTCLTCLCFDMDLHWYCHIMEKLLLIGVEAVKHIIQNKIIKKRENDVYILKRDYDDS